MISPAIHLPGTCNEAIRFYEKVFDATDKHINTADEVCRAYGMLKEGGKVKVALGPQFFSSMYGSIEDRYGVTWQLIS